MRVAATDEVWNGSDILWVSLDNIAALTRVPAARCVHLLVGEGARARASG